MLHQSNTAESSPARPKGGQRPASAVHREREGSSTDRFYNSSSQKNLVPGSSSAVVFGVFPKARQSKKEDEKGRISKENTKLL